MEHLPPISELREEVQTIASRLRKMLKTIVPSVGVDFPITDDFILRFYEENADDIFVLDNVLYIPYMAKNKLVQLQAFFDSEQLPCVLEHEIQHLLDVRHSIEHDYYVAEDTFEKRASQTEMECAQLLGDNYGTIYS